MVRGSGFIGWSGPSLVKGGMGETVELEALGGAEMHARVTGLADLVAETEKDCLDAIKTFLTFMPSSCWELPPRAATSDDPSRLCPELLDIVPSNLRKPYDMFRVITALVDNGNYFAYKPEFGKGLITCLARMGGRPVGMVASQPSHEGSVIDWDTAYKARRFIAVCDAFHIPLIFLQDQPGFLVGKTAEAHRMVFWER